MEDAVLYKMILFQIEFMKIEFDFSGTHHVLYVCNIFSKCKLCRTSLAKKNDAKPV